MRTRTFFSLSLFRPMELSIKLLKRIVWFIASIHGSQVIILKPIVYLSLKMDFVLGTSEDPYVMLNYVAFHLGLHYFFKYLFSKFRQQKVMYMLP